jgi:hypothetical protein
VASVSSIVSRRSAARDEDGNEVTGTVLLQTFVETIRATRNPSIATISSSSFRPPCVTGRHGEPV